MFNKEDYLVYANGTLGEVGLIDFLEGEVHIVPDEDEGTFFIEPLEDATFFTFVGTLGGERIYNGDVVGSVDGQRWEVELQKDGEKVILHFLDKKLERKSEGKVFHKSELEELSHFVDRIGHSFELREELPKVEFRVTTVREVENGEVTYFYAMNNVEKEEVDLIKASIFEQGSEEPYNRITLSHAVFLDSIQAGTITEVKIEEYLNYLVGMQSFKEEEDRVERKRLAITKLADRFGEEETCEVCEEHVDDCTCTVW
ncbi:hypothetical protein [Priestia megaterium]|uniref:hypothetical protein n=1 Tax=Priestia megaterium TaxID=1404 RepID=UPI000BFCFBBA|nr:hypothetical protein [Priestia megaterium]PGO60690.1 hypothetical protein CN981_09065 [Priestia megaterium]